MAAEGRLRLLCQTGFAALCTDRGRRLLGWRGQRRQVDFDARLFAQQARQRRRELLRRSRVAPASVGGAEVKSARSRRDPDLAIRDVAVDDELAVRAAIDFQNAVVEAPVDF